MSPNATASRLPSTIAFHRPSVNISPRTEDIFFRLERSSLNNGSFSAFVVAVQDFKGCILSLFGFKLRVFHPFSFPFGLCVCPSSLDRALVRALSVFDDSPSPFLCRLLFQTSRGCILSPEFSRLSPSSSWRFPAYFADSWETSITLF